MYQLLWPVQRASLEAGVGGEERGKGGGSATNRSNRQEGEEVRKQAGKGSGERKRKQRS